MTKILQLLQQLKIAGKQCTADGGLFCTRSGFDESLL
jgi:hypothetical protein